MRILFLGTAGGGGLPQWNCGCPFCIKARRGLIKPRLECSVAVTDDGEGWLVVDAPADIRDAVVKYEELSPRELRCSPIKSIVLTHPDLNHSLGIANFRGPTTHRYGYVTLYATQWVEDVIKGRNEIFSIVKANWQRLPLREWIPVKDVKGRSIGLEIFAIPVPGKPPTYHWKETEETTIALCIRDRRGSKVTYATVVKAITDELIDIMNDSDCVIFDGTFWENEELLKYDPYGKTAREIGHIPIKDSLPIISSLKSKLKIYTHINNTNPVNDITTEEYRSVLCKGVFIAEDGMEIDL